MRVIVFAYQGIGHACLDELIRLEADVAAVFTHEDDPNENIWFPSVRELALSRDIPVFTPRRINTSQWVDRIEDYGAEFLFSFYYRRLLGDGILKTARRGALNLHGSLLPRYRGRAPVNWAIIQGENETGVTLHHMIARADAGDIVAQRSVPIGPDDTVSRVYGRLSAAARTLLSDMVPQLARGTARRRPQPEARAIYGRRRTPEDGGIDWNCSAATIHNLVRGVTHPYPGAFGRLDGRRLYVWASRVGRHEETSGQPGLVVGHQEGRGVALVKTGAGLLELHRVQKEGEKATSGLSLPPGAVLQQGLVEADPDSAEIPTSLAMEERG